MNHINASLCAKKPVPAPAITVDFPGPHCKNRLSEWTMAGAFFASGLLIYFWPAAWAYSAFAPIHDALSYQFLAFICLSMGLIRGSMLWANGQLPIWGPRIRAIGAIAGAMLLISMIIALIRTVFEVGRPPSPGIPFYTALFIAELISARRAAADARLRLQ